MDLTTLVGLVVALALGTCLGALATLLWSRDRGAAAAEDARVAALEHRAADAALVKDGLTRLEEHLHDLHDQRVGWQSQLHTQVDAVRQATEQLRRETSSLATALRRPQVRGRWGELHLRRAVEVAGLVGRCDFEEQVSLTHDGAVLRPDLVVHLAGGKDLVVDSKVPLDAFLDACDADPGDDDTRQQHLLRHARQLRSHVDTLASKAYWRALPATPEFVVLFVPGESFLSAALEVQPSLIEHAADRQVVLATPTTLIALLRTVAYAWTQQTLADKAQEIHELGRDLHDRLATMGGHLDRLGRSLTGAVSAYNRAIGSLENRVLVSARRFGELGVSSAGLDAPEPVVDVPRPMTAAELMEQVAEPRPELPELELPSPRREEPPSARRVAT
jgi:DNA recombination protein RmuC